MNRAEALAAGRQIKIFKSVVRYDAFCAGGWDRVPVAEAMAAFGVSARTVSRWRARMYADAKAQARAGQTSPPPGPRTPIHQEDTCT